MLLVGRQQLVPGVQADAGDHGVDAVRRRANERDLVRLGAEQRRVATAHLGPHRAELVPVRRPRTTLFEDHPRRRGGSVEGLTRDRPVGPGVQVRDTLEDRELRPQRAGVRRHLRARRTATADAGERERVAHA